MESLYKDMEVAIVEGDDEVVVPLVQKALDAGDNPKAILDRGLVAGMDIVAVKFKEGDMFVPEVLMSAQAMQAGNDLLKPLLSQSESDIKGTIVIGTVEGDLHDIGKKIVSMMLEGSGFKVIDVGMDVPAEKFVGAVKESNASIVGMSAMLTTTMLKMQDVADSLMQEDLGHVKVMIGGAPVSEEYAEQIQANYSYDAASAVELANKIISL